MDKSFSDKSLLLKKIIFALVAFDLVFFLITEPSRLIFMPISLILYYFIFKKSTLARLIFSILIAASWGYFLPNIFLLGKINLISLQVILQTIPTTLFGIVLWMPAFKRFFNKPTQTSSNHSKKVFG